ncbi:MAG: substrate-binding domain-containing protein [Thermoplasmata archaeon]
MSTQDPQTASSSAEQTSSPQRRRTGTIGTGVAIAIAIVLLLVGIGAGYFIGAYLTKTSSSKTQITETGSSLLYPLMNIWGPNFTSQVNSNIVLSTDSTGSGTGQSYAEQGLIDIGASDGYLSNASTSSLVNVPVAISAQLVVYNIPGLSAGTHLNLNGSILAMIYAGVITTWNNPLIVAANPGVSLPTNTIVPFVRSDSSGDTFLFSSLCYMSWAGWTYGYSTKAFANTAVKWTGEMGNTGMVGAVTTTAYSIAYVGISYEKSVTGISGVNWAAVGDAAANSASGGVNATNYVLPSAATIGQDANLALSNLQFASYGLSISLILGGASNGQAINITLGGGGKLPTTQYPTPYPITNLEYTLVKTTSRPNTAAFVQFLEWAISFGNLPVYLNQVNFVPLTSDIVGLDMQELSGIQL